MPIFTNDQNLSSCENPEAQQWQTQQWQAHKRRKSSEAESANKRKPAPLLLSPEHNGKDAVSPTFDAIKSPTAHKPTLKGVGKSDCQVRIISIAECESEAAWESLGNGNDDLTFNSEAILEIVTNGRTLTLPDEQSLSLGGSRAIQARRALQRPLMARSRKTSVSPNPHLAHKRFKGQKGFISSSTIRRLTSGMWAVRKQAFSGGKQDGSRLLKQIRKQLAFSASCRRDHMNATISTPEIYGLKAPRPHKEQGSIIVDMEYIPFHDIAYIMLEQDKAVNDWLIGAAIAIVDYELTRSNSVPLKEIMPEFHTKAESIKKALIKSPLFNQTEITSLSEQIDCIIARYDTMPDLHVPVGNCHGDLTFQNMLVDPVNRELCVFDFLDCFVESPLQDIAKLLQDCRHQWFFTQVAIPEHRRARAVATLSFFHERLRMDYELYAFWEALPLFEFMCLARILPYMTHEKEKECVMRGLQSVMKDLQIITLQSTLPTENLMHDLDINSELEPQGDELVTVIVPAMGPDSRRMFPDGKIKPFTINPNGRALIADCVSALGTEKVSRIIIAIHKPLVEEHCGDLSTFEAVFDVLDGEKRSKIQFSYAEKETTDVIETVTAVLKSHHVTGPFFIKDADNNFAHDVDAGNYAAFLKIVRDETPLATPFSSQGSSRRHLRPDLIDATKKSYISFSYDNIVSDLSHGSFISSQFCCGGYSFMSTEAFLYSAASLRNLVQAASLDTDPKCVRLRVIDVIWRMLCEGHLFFGAEVSEYDDWGSPAAWKAYRSTFTTSWVEMSYLIKLLQGPDPGRRLHNLLNLPRRSIIFYTAMGEHLLVQVRAMCERAGADTSRLQMLHSVVSPKDVSNEEELVALGL